VVGAALHGALLTAALGAAAGASGGAWTATRPATITLALIALGAAASRFDGRGPVLYLAVLVWLSWLGVRGRLAPIGVRATSARAIFVGGLAGVALGSHVLLSAAFTLGYRVRGDGVAAWLLALAYDAGLSVPSAELFVRGVVFDGLQRRVSFTTGAVVAAICYLVRFLPDPRLPTTVEVLAGATLYLTLLSVVNSWLFWWSGSLLPALASALAFFAAYRLLGT
ncbi:MAG: CPBP family glutamic-type intramembrane protease, partial [Candidatus Rokuibacteriota bacterium]